jgi:endonuclease VIII
MPEGHTLHKLARELHAGLAGTIPELSSPQGRFAAADAISGELLLRADALGKHLLLEFESTTVHVHLGLFGRVFRHRGPPPPPRDSIRLRLAGATRTWDICGPTCCELLDEAGLAKLKNRIGADPLAPSLDANVVKQLEQKLKRTRRPIGSVLLDQSILSGIGNVYRAEILFILKTNPMRPANALTRKEITRIWQLTVELLARGAKAGRIITKAPKSGARPTRGESLHVYRKRTCAACGAVIVALNLGGRPLYACPTCQGFDPAAGEPSTAPRRRMSDAAEALAMAHH